MHHDSWSSRVGYIYAYQSPECGGPCARLGGLRRWRSAAGHNNTDARPSCRRKAGWSAFGRHGAEAGGTEAARGRPAGRVATVSRRAVSASLLATAPCSSDKLVKTSVCQSGRSFRIPRNSFGPLISRRLRLSRSSWVAEGSARRSMASLARSTALARVRRLTGPIDTGEAASPSSTSRRMASERRGLSACLAAQASIRPLNSLGGRSPKIDYLPFALQNIYHNLVQ